MWISRRYGRFSMWFSVWMWFSVCGMSFYNIKDGHSVDVTHSLELTASLVGGIKRRGFCVMGGMGNAGVREFDIAI